MTRTSLRLALIGDSLAYGSGAAGPRDALGPRLAAALAAALAGLREAGTDVVVVPAPDMSTVPWVPPALRPLVQVASRQLQQEQAAVARANGAMVAAVSDAVSAAFGIDPALFSTDRFHPSSAGYAHIAQALVPHVVAAAHARRDGAAA